MPCCGKKAADKENGKLLEKKEDEAPPVSLIQLFRYTTNGDKVLLVIGFIVSVATGAGTPLLSVLIGDISQNFIDVEARLANQTDDQNLYEIYDQFSVDVKETCLKYLYLGIGVFSVAILQILCFLLVSEKMTDRMRRHFLAAVLRQDIAWFDAKATGSFATKLFDNVDRVKEGTGEKMGLFIQFIAQFIGGFTVALIKDWRLTVVMLALVPFLAICGFFITAGAVAEEALAAIRTVISFNGQKIESQKYDVELTKGKRSGLKKAFVMGIGMSVTFLTLFASYCLAFWAGTDFVYYGTMEGGVVMTVFFSVMMGSMALGQAGPLLGLISIARTAAGQLYSVIDRIPEIDSLSQEGLKPEGLQGCIKVQNVHFAYPSRPEVHVLNGLNLEAKAGQTVAIVGPSGCGKSSLIQLLLRYYNAAGGKITIDDIEIDKLNIEYLRNFIGVVSQEPVLFNTTIEENIRYGRWDLSKWEIEDALKKANAFEFVDSFPEVGIEFLQKSYRQGLNTVVGDRGTQLSGGQKQRLAIARALVRNPRILLLDEATSALDAESEHIVQTALENASKGRTTVVIAHRLSTIRNADLIVAMEDGKVVETGTHDELLTQKGLYYDLVNAQIVVEETRSPRASISMERRYSTDRRYSMSDRRYSRSISHDTPRSAGEVQRLKSQTEIHDVSPGIDKKQFENTKQDVERLKEELKEEGAKRATLWSILKYARPEWGYLGTALVFSALQGVIFPAFSLFFAQIISVFSNPNLEEMRSDGHWCAIAFIVLGVVQAVFVLVQTISFGFVAEGMTERMRSSLFRNILRMDGTYFDAPIHSPGKIVTRLATDAPNVKSAIDSRLGSLLGEVVSSSCGICISLYFGWKMALPVIVIFSLAALLQSARMRYVTRKAKEAEKDIENSGKIALEAIENIRSVQALTLEHRIHSEFCQHLEEPLATSKKKAYIQGLAQGLAVSMFYFLFAASFRLGLYLIVKGYLQPMNVIRVMFAISFTAGGLGVISAYLPDYLKATLAAGLIFSMMRQDPEIDETTEDGERPAISGAITFEGVVFQYPERSEITVLDGLNIELVPGKTLALVGPSGCGKSTTIALLERLYNPTRGHITVDGVKIQNINPSHLRSHVGLVSQEPVLFDCSIRENIVYGLPENSYTDDDIYTAAKDANIHKFIVDLPQGYDTPAGDRGTQLSGGQKQRLAIARVLIRKPKVLLLDEATSALDTESEGAVQEALEKASEGRAVLVIAHRLSTITSADSIAVIVDGRVVEKGDHRELMAKRGVYYELQVKQSGK